MRAHGVENLLVALLRHNAVRRVAVAAAEAEELLKRVFEVQLRAPAEALGERHGNLSLIHICAAAGALYRALPRKTVSVYLSLIIAMIAGRLVWGVMRYLLAGLAHSTFTPALFLAGAVTTAIPGIILHIILIPALVIAMDKARLIPD